MRLRIFKYHGTGNDFVLFEDLADRGMLDNVLVIAMSEFGRTPRINGQVGRDHWPEAWSLVTGGCGIRKVFAVHTNITSERS